MRGVVESNDLVPGLGQRLDDPVKAPGPVPRAVNEDELGYALGLPVRAVVVVVPSEQSASDGLLALPLLLRTD